VLLETDSVGICGSDVHYWQHGRIGDFVLTKPMILGHETSAIVREIGSDVVHLSPGQRVAVEPGESCARCDYCKQGRYNLCVSMRFHATPPYDGTLRRYFVHPAHLCFVLPDEVDSESGACVEPLSVGVHACNRARVACGHRVLILGAGPIGLVSLLVAKAYGASTICITGKPSVRSPTTLDRPGQLIPNLLPV
jgi:L-iditol 2-dehydrogenase